jgi:cytochrome o ubiquinol oxidase subunit 2
MDPKGQIGADEKSLIITATVLMLIVVIPVIIMILAFAWKYRASNTSAKFMPDWAHSNKIEAVMWAIPIIIILILGTITWTSTHELDPYKPIASNEKPITIEAVSLDWKWLFIYPDQGIATVNQIALPVGVPVTFKITSASVMNAFFIPQLGSQIYAMAGMETQLNLIANEAGAYDGISSNFSGDGFADMRFKAIATTRDGFDNWVATAKRSSVALDTATYDQLASPSHNNQVAFYSAVDPNLYHNILHAYMDGDGMSKTMKMGKAADGMHMDMSKMDKDAMNPGMSMTMPMAMETHTTTGSGAAR